MSKKELWQQCELTNGNRQLVTWIPRRFAKFGKELKVEFDGQWDEGWKVTGKGMTSVNPPDPQKVARQHKKHTGDSLPKG